ncbi:MAG: hypothetical protein LC789_08105 [Actinobacteria bacterium]|nr:hypothetical protein [Actinomycetota bacterium]
MTTGVGLDRNMIPDRIAGALPVALIEELHAEATQIKSAETQLHMRRVVLVTRLRENGMSWDSCGWFFGATGEAVRKFYGSLLGDSASATAPETHRGRPDGD